MAPTSHASAASSHMQRRRAAHMPREEWHPARLWCVAASLVATVLILGIRYSTRTEGSEAPQLSRQSRRTVNPWEQSSGSAVARGQGRAPAEALPVCQQPSLHVGGGVFVVPDLLDDAAPCRPPLTAAAAELAGTVISDYPVPGAPASCPALAAGHLTRERLRCDCKALIGSTCTRPRAVSGQR